MPFHINSSAAFAADPNQAADGAAHSAVANAPRTGSSSVVRNLFGKYVGFNLALLSKAMGAFSSPQDASESSLDQKAYTKLIFDQVQHRFSGKQNELEATLRRMEELLNSASAQPAAGAAPQAGPQPGPQPGPQSRPQPSPQQTPRPSAQDAPQEAPHAANAEPAEPVRTEHDHQQHARRHATQMRRTIAQFGQNNALSLLGGHAAPDGQGHSDHHTAPADGRDASLLEEFRALREELRDALAARPPSRPETDNG